MDLDLFAAFDGVDKANDVEEAKDEQFSSTRAGKRKMSTGGAGTTTKRQGRVGKQAAVANNRSSGDRSLAVTSESEGPVALAEGEESSTMREDGTLVKSVSRWWVQPLHPVGTERHVLQEGGTTSMIDRP